MWSRWGFAVDNKQTTPQQAAFDREVYLCNSRDRMISTHVERLHGARLDMQIPQVGRVVRNARGETLAGTLEIVKYPASVNPVRVQEHESNVAEGGERG